MMKYLGIDYGLAHIGLATSEAILATPLPSIKNDDKLTLRLLDIINKEGITSIVCGVPEGKLEEIIEKFASDLKTVSGIPVILHKETLSTQEATQKLRAIGAKRSKLKDDHEYAACLILEDYLELTATS